MPNDGLIRAALGLDEHADVSKATVYEGKLTDYALDLADEMGWLDALDKAGINRAYFDEEQFAFDMMLSGDVVPLHKTSANRRDDVSWSGGIWLLEFEEG